MKISAYSACQRRAINQVWTVCGDYRFEPQFLAMRSDGQPDLYLNCIIGLVHKWFGDDMPKKLFASWAGDARQTMYDDLAWLALENADTKKSCPGVPHWMGCGARMPLLFSPRNTGFPGRNGWRKTSLCMPSSPRGGNPFWARSRPC